jgi:hypothetical protein
MRGGCLFMPHSTNPIESGWRRCDSVRLPGRGVHTKRRQERAEYAEGPVSGGRSLCRIPLENTKIHLKIRLRSTVYATIPKRPGAQK